MTARPQARGKPTPAEQLAQLTRRLTSRDRHLLGLLAEHAVLTSEQAAALAYPTRETARRRLAELASLGVLDRFRPQPPPGQGSVPYRYLLGPAGVEALAAEHGLPATALAQRREQAASLAHTPLLLARLLAVNEFFAQLAARARAHPAAELVAWWPASRCAQRWGAVVRPDGYGRWREGPAELDFFLELDRGTEPLARLAAKLPGYADLARLTGVTTWLLVWLPTPSREAAARRALAATPAAAAVPVATAWPAGSPAAAVWLPAGQPGPRRRLAALGHATSPVPAGGLPGT